MAADISNSIVHLLESLLNDIDNGSNPTVRIGDTTSAAAVTGVYSAVVEVTVPSIADAEADEVAVDVASAFSVSVAVGDHVLVAPTEALPTNCLLAGAYVSATDEVTISFDTLEGGAGVTGAASDFRITVIKVA
jgi:hypothetical protein